MLGLSPNLSLGVGLGVIFQGAGAGGGVGITFWILAEDGKALLTEASDNLRTEQN